MCIYKAQLVCTHWVVQTFTLYKGCGDFFKQGLIRPTRFLNTIFQLQKLVSKTHREKVSTADSQYVVEGKIFLVAVIKKSWFWFWT